jgi:hypothetical protein
MDVWTSITDGTTRNHLSEHRATRNGDTAAVRLEPGLADHVASESKEKRNVGAAPGSSRDPNSIWSFHATGVSR